MTRRSSTLAVLVSLIVVACGPTNLPLTQTPTPTPTPKLGPTSFMGIHAPVAAGETMVVYNGYDNPPPGAFCPDPGTNLHDHCGNQEDGLDLIPSNLADPRILAPVDGTIGWTSSGAMACLGITLTGSKLNLDVCHFATGQIFVKPGDAVVAGQVLGLRDPNAWWIHLSLDDRATPKPFPPVAFDGTHEIEGVAFPAENPQAFNLYCGTTLTSTTSVATEKPNATELDYASYLAAPALHCTAPTLMPTPTPFPPPDAATISTMISDFYDRLWTGSYQLTTLDQVVTLPEYLTFTWNFWACAALHYAPVPRTSGTAGQEVMAFGFGVFAGPVWAIGSSSGFNGFPTMSACVAANQNH